MLAVQQSLQPPWECGQAIFNKKSIIYGHFFLGNTNSLCLKQVGCWKGFQTDSISTKDENCPRRYHPSKEDVLILQRYSLLKSWMGSRGPWGNSPILENITHALLTIIELLRGFRKFFWLKGSAGILIDDEPWGTEIKVQKSRVNLSAQLSRSWCIAKDVTVGACFESFTFLDLSSFLFHAFPGGRDNVGGLHAFGSSKEEEACPT